MHRFFRHLSFLLSFSLFFFLVGSAHLQAQIAGPVQIFVNGPSGGLWTTGCAINKTITFNGEAALPGETFACFLQQKNPDGSISAVPACTITGSITSFSNYDAGVNHSLPITANPAACFGNISFSWVPTTMYTPQIANNSVCSKSTFDLTLPMKGGDKIDEFRWEQSTNNGISWGAVSGVASSTTANATIQITAPFVTSQQSIQYRVTGYRNGNIVAPTSAGLPIFIFPPPLDDFTGVAYSQNLSTNWNIEDRIPVQLQGITVGEVIVSHLKCKTVSDGRIRIKFNAPFNPTGNYFYSLANGDFRDSKFLPPRFATSDIFSDDGQHSTTRPVPTSVQNISNPPTDATFPPLGEGTYTLAIENVSGGQRYCYGKYLIKVKAPSAPITGTITGTKNPTCINGTDGEITVQAGGGATAETGYTGGYTIRLYREGNATPINTQATTGSYSFAGLGRGNYYAEVLENGCGTSEIKRVPTSGFQTLQDPNPIQATAAVKDEILCEGGTGSIDVTLTQGNANGTYRIDAFRNGSLTAQASLTGVTFSAGSKQTFSNLPTGSYTFRLTHETCTGASADTYDIPGSVTLVDVTPVSGTATGLKKSGSTFELTCSGANDGQIQVTIATGKTTTPNNVYSLILKSGGTTIASPNFAATGVITPTNIKVGETLNFTNLAEGTYIVEVSQNGCTGTTKVLGTTTLTAPPAITATITPVTKFSTFQVSCAEGEDGEIVVSSVAGGNGTYTVELFENGVLVTPTATNKIIDAVTGTTTFKELRPKNFGGSAVAYTIKITDSKGCELNSAAFQLEAPTAIGSLLTPAPVTCKGESNGSITAQISGGTQPYTIEWRDSGGALLLSTTLGATETSHTLSGQPAGTYTFRVRDVNGCPVTGTSGWHENTATITEPAAPLAFEVASFIIDSVSCNGASDGRITLAATGGWGSYEYSQDGTSYQTSPVFSGLVAATYTLYLKDAQNCVVTTTVEVKQPTALTLAQTQITHVSCNGGFNGVFTFTAQGGNDASSQPYTILLNGAAHSETDWSNWGTNKQITLRGLAANTYTIQATDHKGCNETLNFTITEPAKLAASISNIVAATCGERNGSAQVAVTGGTTPYTYAWKKYDAASGTLRTWSTTTTLTGAEGGAYEMIVTDALGCSITQIVQISNADAAQTTIQNIQATSCAESKDGSATLTLAGDFPIEVTWVDAANETGTITPQNTTTVQLSGLYKGYHDFQTKDSKGCVRFETVLVSGPETLLITRDSSNDPTCHNGTNGNLGITVSGGTAPYTITWDNGLAAGATAFNNLAAGTYTVQVSDANGCQRQASFILQNPLPISVDLGTGSTVCEGQSVTLRPTIPAGNTIATYQWTSASGSFISAASEVTVSAADTYFLQVTTTTGCTGTGQYKLETSTDLFEADFLMNDEAVVGDTVVVIEVCRPAPTTLFWDIEGLGSAVEVLEPTVTNARQSLVFKQTGTYTVKLYASAGNCQDVYEQQITVTEADGQRRGNAQAAQTGSSGHHIQAQVSPNPVSEGKFKITVDLALEASVKAEVFSLSTGKRWRLPQPLQGSGQTHYEWTLEMPELTYGTYAVRVQTPHGQKIVKVVIN
ncbi:hypothetical protein BKI52_19305 [marine bacterium AO1-C]|nr:hypothetical protein BKI52_19305 [marine bacterium AO1-C]